MSNELLQKASDSIRPSGFLDYRLYLASLYDFMKRESETYSYQRFADDLGFGATTVMHQIVQRRRPLTLKACEKVVKALAIKGMERRFLLALVEYGNTRDSARREQLFAKMLDLKSHALPTEFDKDVLEYFSEWFHPVVRELVGTESFAEDAQWIATRIVPRIRPEQAKESLALLEKLGLIDRDPATGRLRQTQKRISTGHRVKGLAFTRYHQKMIELGKEALTRVSSKRRDISAVTVSVNEAAVEQLRSMIHAFQIQLLDAAERAAGDEIFQVNIQLFPFTESREKEPS